MNLYPTLTKLYKEGSVQGQCFSFLHKLAQFNDVGNLEGQKIKSLNNFGIPISKLDSFKVGDILLLDYPIFGHGAMINSFTYDKKLQLTESNFNLDLKVHHTRVISPEDSKILGVFRAPLLFPVPQEPSFNKALRIKLVMNNQPDWKSLTKHAYNITNWFYTHSNYQILPVVDWTYTNFTDIPVKYQPDTFGNNPVKIIDETWFNDNVVPLSQGFDAVLFVMPKKDWTDSVLNNPSLTELGYAYPSDKLPMRALIALDEFDDYAPYYPDLGAFAKYVCHELCHNLYHVCPNDKIVPGGDYTHNHFYGENNYLMKPEDCFNDYNLSKL